MPGHIDSFATKENALSLQPHALLEGGGAAQLNLPSGPDDPVPGNSDCAAKSRRNLTSPPAQAGRPRNRSVSRHHSSRNPVNRRQDPYSRGRSHFSVAKMEKAAAFTVAESYQNRKGGRFGDKGNPGQTGRTLVLVPDTGRSPVSPIVLTRRVPHLILALMVLLVFLISLDSFNAVRSECPAMH